LLVITGNNEIYSIIKSLIFASLRCKDIEIIKGSAIVVLSPKKELNLVSFVSQILPYIQPCQKYMFQTDIASGPGQRSSMV